MICGQANEGVLVADLAPDLAADELHTHLLRLDDVSLEAELSRGPGQVLWRGRHAGRMVAVRRIDFDPADAAQVRTLYT